MRTQRDFDRTTQAWLAEGPTVLADRVLDAALVEIHETHQARRGLLAPWRFPDMHLSARLVAPALVVMTVAALGVALVVGSPRPSPTPGPTVTLSPTASPAAVADPCNHLLVPRLLMTVGCTYASTAFINPITITVTADWLVSDERPTAISFQGYEPSIQNVEVRAIVLRSLVHGGCLSSTTDLSNAPVPQTAADYLAWLRQLAPAASGPVAVTVGGVPALQMAIPAIDEACQSLGLGAGGTGNEGDRTALECFPGPCTLDVIDLGNGRIVLLETVLPTSSDAEARGLATFLEGLRFTP